MIYGWMVRRTRYITNYILCESVCVTILCVCVRQYVRITFVTRLVVTDIHGGNEE